MFSIEEYPLGKARTKLFRCAAVRHHHTVPLYCHVSSHTKKLRAAISSEFRKSYGSIDIHQGNRAKAQWTTGACAKLCTEACHPNRRHLELFDRCSELSGDTPSEKIPIVLVRLRNSTFHHVIHMCRLSVCVCVFVSVCVRILCAR